MSQRYLSTYYFHGQDLCIVPRHVRADIAWMKEHHVDGVFVGMHDADLLGGNTAMVCEMIREAGLDVWLIPSRVGGLVAGWGRQPSFLSTHHPEWWGRQANGMPRESYGPQVSVFHPAVSEALAETVSRMLQQCPATGIVWDEVKTLVGEDHSEAAIQALGHPATASDMVTGTVRCLSRVNHLLKQAHPELKIACFLVCFSPQEHLDACAAMEHLDQFGCDGKCHFPGESLVGEGAAIKALMGGNDARFAAAARAAGRLPFTLLETQLLDEATLELSLRRMPEYLASKTGHLTYYYYPYGMHDPERFMPKIGAQMAAWRRGALDPKVN